jgi:DNA-binding CsgD family transcriptional regulator
MAATVAEVDAAATAEAAQRRDLAGVATARERVAAVLAHAEAVVRNSGVPRTIGSRREADAYLGTARAYRRRVDGGDDPATWAALAAVWSAQGNPYEKARARWRQAEALLSSQANRAGRAGARTPLTEAATIALELGARPLLRELHDLARRARLSLPTGVDAVIDADRAALAGPGGNGHGTLEQPVRGSKASVLMRGLVGEPTVARRDTFGLSGREKEVLGLIAEGRTNREIGERLFISQKTVGVHVGNILAKLGVSGRVEAAAVAIRLELTGRRQS